MIGRSKDWLLGLSGGVLLALMVHYNSLLAQDTSPVLASWIAHGVGAVSSLVFILIHLRLSSIRKKETNLPRKDFPFWFYLGGVPGIFTVILAAIVVNSKLAMAGSIALMLVGQVVFGIFSDCFGWFGMPKKRIVLTDFLVTLCILFGSAMIIFGRGQV